jgi:hypothetical protein
MYIEKYAELTHMDALLENAVPKICHPSVFHNKACGRRVLGVDCLSTAGINLVSSLFIKMPSKPAL